MLKQIFQNDKIRIFLFSLILAVLIYTLTLPLGYQNSISVNFENNLPASPELSVLYSDSPNSHELDGYTLIQYKPRLGTSDIDIMIDLQGEGVSIVPIKLTDEQTLTPERKVELEERGFRKNRYYSNPEVSSEDFIALEIRLDFADTIAIKPGKSVVPCSYSIDECLKIENDYPQIIAKYKDLRIIRHFDHIEARVERIQDVTVLSYSAFYPLDEGILSGPITLRVNYSFPKERTKQPGYVEIYINELLGQRTSTKELPIYENSNLSLRRETILHPDLIDDLNQNTFSIGQEEFVMNLLSGTSERLQPHVDLDSYYMRKSGNITRTRWTFEDSFIFKKGYVAIQRYYPKTFYNWLDAEVYSYAYSSTHTKQPITTFTAESVSTPFSFYISGNAGEIDKITLEVNKNPL